VRRRKHALAVVLLLAVACASVGSGDPIVVRAEDVLSNSLVVYSQAMDFHFHHSKEESPAVYKTFEQFRVRFPVAWSALDGAKRSYQKDKKLGTNTIEAAIRAVTDLLTVIQPLIGGK
jgi:hypothetical protein